MSKLVIDTTKSLYKPIEIEINGTVYTIECLSTEYFEKSEKYDEGIAKGSIDSSALWLHNLVGVPLKLAKRMDLREINRIKIFITNKIYEYEPEPKNVESGGKEETK
jgi:hypothetical protein